MLEETGLPYEPHLVALRCRSDQLTPEFLSLSPNNKIPAILDPDGPGGKPLPLFESGAILIYLADKSGQLLPADAAGRYETIQWLMFQMGGDRADVRPGRLLPQVRRQGLRGQAAARPLRRRGEAAAGVLDERLGGRAWIMGDDYSIADIAIFPWVNNLISFYGAGELVGIDDFANVQRVLAAFLERPAVVRGLDIPARPKPA